MLDGLPEDNVCIAPGCTERIPFGKGCGCNTPGHRESAAMAIGNFGSGVPCDGGIDQTE
jgi:hypothetical protein